MLAKRAHRAGLRLGHPWHHAQSDSTRSESPGRAKNRLQSTNADTDDQGDRGGGSGVDRGPGGPRRACPDCALFNEKWVKTLFHTIPDEPNWRPQWRDFLDLIERVNHNDTTPAEQEWLHQNATYWLVGASYLRNRADRHIGQERLALKSKSPEQSGTTSVEYLKAKRAADDINKRRGYFIELLERQIAEARYILGYETIPHDTRARTLSALAALDQLIRAERSEDALALLASIMRDLAEPID